MSACEQQKLCWVYLLRFVHLGICLAFVFKDRIPACAVDCCQMKKCKYNGEWGGKRRTELCWATRSYDFALDRKRK